MMFQKSFAIIVAIAAATFHFSFAQQPQSIMPLPQDPSFDWQSQMYEPDANFYTIKANADANEDGEYIKLIIQ